DGDVSTALTATVQGALQLRAWWTNAALFESEAKVQQVVRTLGSAIGQETAAAFAAARHQDLVRAAASGGMTKPLFRAITEWAVDMDLEQIGDLATRLRQAPLASDQAHNVELLLARTHLWRQAWDLDEETAAEDASYAFDMDQVVGAARSGGRRAQEL